MTSNTRSIGPRSIAAALCLAATLGAGATASAQSVVVNPTGGTMMGDGLRVTVGENGQLQIHLEGSGQLYSPSGLPPSDSMFNGVFLALGSTVHGPNTAAETPCSNVEDVFWTPVSQTAVAGTGTAADPFTSTTTLAAGATGVTLALEVSYVAPNQYVDLSITVDAPAMNTEVVKVYHLLDTFLSGADEGPGFVDPMNGTPNVVGVRRTDVYEALVSGDRAFDHWYSAHYGTMFCQADDGSDLLDTVDPNPSTDNGIGAEWNLGVVTGTVTWSYRIAFGDPSEARCGNGAVLAPEECDDGNTTPNDGCSDTCITETGYSCVGTTPSVCTRCGDGMVAGSEECDDGGTAPSDGCSATCTTEPGFFCSGTPSICVRCRNDADCSGGTPICDAGDCRACAIATQATDCPMPALPICSTAGPSAGTCIASSGLGICYLGGNTASGFVFNGDATFDSMQIQITADVNSQAGSVFYENQLSTAGNLQALFTVDLSTTDGNGADGMAFVMQRAPEGAMALGIAGEGIGYGGLTPSVVIEFDTFQNGFDPDNNHVAITTLGVQGTHVVGPVMMPFDIRNAIVNIWIDYNGTTNQIDVYMAREATRPGTPVLTGTLDFPSILGPSFFVGLTASTGGFRTRHAISRLAMTDATVTDADGDGVFDTCDLDDDNDCLLDGADSSPTDPGLPAGMHCSSGTPICTVVPADPTIGTCVECTMDAHCGAETCNLATFTCNSTMMDGGVPDGGVPDGGVPDGGLPDGGLPDGGLPDGGGADASADGDVFNVTGNGIGCDCRAAPGAAPAPGLLVVLGLGLLLALRRRRTPRD